MSTNIENMQVSCLYKFNREIALIEKDGTQIYKLNMGQPDISTDKSYYNALKKIKKGINKYGDCRGLEDLRVKFSEYYNEKNQSKKYTKDDVQITLGASDAIISILMSICNSNDSVILVEPFFSDYRIYCQMLNIKILPFTIKQLLYEDIEIPVHCKAILFSNPNNPNGYIFNSYELNKIIDISKNNNLYIISDEVYSEIIYEDFISLSSFDYKNIIVVDSVSKKFSNCGARIGCMITQNQTILKNIEKIYDARIAISNAEQIAAASMFHKKNKIFKNNLKIYSERKLTVENFLKNQKLIGYEVPKGGIFFILDLPVKDSEEFSDWLLKKYRKNNKTVFLLPANGFYSKGNKSKVRLTIANDSKYTLEALKILMEALKIYRER